MVAASYCLAYFGGKLGVFPTYLAQYNVIARGTIIAAVGVVFTTLFSIAVAIGVAHYLQWRYSHIDSIQQVKSNE